MTEAEAVQEIVTTETEVGTKAETEAGATAAAAAAAAAGAGAGAGAGTVTGAGGAAVAGAERGIDGIGESGVGQEIVLVRTVTETETDAEIGAATHQKVTTAITIENNVAAVTAKHLALALPQLLLRRRRQLTIQQGTTHLAFRQAL